MIAHGDGSLEVLTDPYEFQRIRAAIEKAGMKAELGEVTMSPRTRRNSRGRRAEDAEAARCARGLDDVQDVYTTAALG